MSMSKRTAAGVGRLRGVLCAVCAGLLVCTAGAWLTVRQTGSSTVSTPVSAARQAADLGLILQSTESQDGVYVLAVMDQGAASVAGIQAGDTILSVDGVSLASAAEFDERLPENAGTTLTLTLLRGGDELCVKVTP